MQDIEEQGPPDGSASEQKLFGTKTKKRKCSWKDGKAKINRRSDLKHKDKLLSKEFELQEAIESYGMESTAQHGTARHSTAQHSTAQHQIKSNQIKRHKEFITLDSRLTVGGSMSGLLRSKSTMTVCGAFIPAI